MQSAIERERDSRREACWSSRCHDWTHIQTHSFRHTHSDTHITAQTPCVCRWLDTHSDTLTFRHTHTFRHTPECANTLWGIWRLTIVTWYALLCATFIICGTLHSYVTYDCCFWLDLLCVLLSWLSKRHMLCDIETSYVVWYQHVWHALFIHTMNHMSHMIVAFDSICYVFCFLDYRNVICFVEA